MAANPTFVFDDDGRAYAYVAGKIVAAADDADELERKLQDEEQDQEDAKEASAQSADESLGATHVRTPNGLKGTILGKQKGLWGEQVTIRLENGRIAKFDVTPESKIEYVKEGNTSDSVRDRLRARLDATPDGTKASLVARVTELKKIKHEAASLVRSSSYADQVFASTVISEADQELREVTDALSALEDAEPYAPPAPFQTGVVEQEAMGGQDSTWLDNAAQEMVTENEATDFDAMLNEAPEVMVSELDTPVLEDRAAVQEEADRLVSSKTAGLNPEAASDYKQAFFARADQARREELARRQAEVHQIREAATETNDGPADALFM